MLLCIYTKSLLIVYICPSFLTPNVGEMLNAESTNLMEEEEEIMIEI